MARRDGGKDAYEVLFGYDSDYAYAADIIKHLYLGPGKPGPGDKWRVPRGPLVKTAGEAEDGTETAGSDHRDWLRRLGGLLTWQPPR